jgi:hypothetical protein
MRFRFVDRHGGGRRADALHAYPTHSLAGATRHPPRPR